MNTSQRESHPVYLTLGVSIATLLMLWSSHWFLHQMKSRHQQSVIAVQELQAEIKRLHTAHEAEEVERQLMQAADAANLSVLAFSDRQVAIATAAMPRDRLNTALSESLTVADGFFVVESFSMESPSTHEGLFNALPAESTSLPILTLKGRQFFRK